MRKLVALLVVSISLVAQPAIAQRGYDHGHYGHHGGGGSGLAGLAIFGALTGLAIMAERSRPVYVDPYYAGPVYAPQPIYVEQPALPTPPVTPANTWYYCASSAMYYPYTQACPEGWQAVPARPY
ncbi:MAG: hypothetical protein ACM3X0_07405 [Bacteroidota bacterium]